MWVPALVGAPVPGVVAEVEAVGVVGVAEEAGEGEG